MKTKISHYNNIRANILLIICIICMIYSIIFYKYDLLLIISSIYLSYFSLHCEINDIYKEYLKNKK